MHDVLLGSECVVKIVGEILCVLMQSGCYLGRVIVIGHVDFGIKWLKIPLCLIRKNFTPIMPLCLEGEWYAKAVVLYITTAFYATG